MPRAEADHDAPVPAHLPAAERRLADRLPNHFEAEGRVTRAGLVEHYHEEGLWLIAITRFEQDRDQQHSKEAGIDYHLVKPVDPELLKTVLEMIRSAPSPLPLPGG